MLTDSYERLQLTVTGRKSSESFAEGADVNDALEALQKYFDIREHEIPPRLKTLEEKMDYLLSASDIMYRRVTLEPGWHRDAMGVLVTNLKDSGAVITVMRNSAGVYTYRDPLSGRMIRVNRQEEQKIGQEAYCFYRPLPLRKITFKDLLQYMFDTIRPSDLGSFALASLAIVLVGMLIPKLNHILMEEVVTSGSYQLLAAVVSFMFFATLGSFLLSIIKQLVLQRIQVKLSVNVQVSGVYEFAVQYAGQLHFLDGYHRHFFAGVPDADLLVCEVTGDPVAGGHYFDTGDQYCGKYGAGIDQQGADGSAGQGEGTHLCADQRH